MIYKDIKTGTRLPLKQPFKPGNVFVLRYPPFDPTKLGDKSGSTLNLFDKDGNILLHVNQRGKMGFTSINASFVADGFGEENRKTLVWKKQYPNKDNCNHNLAIYDLGDFFEVLFDFRPIHVFEKRDPAELVRFYVDWSPDFGGVGKVEVWDTLYNLLNYNDCMS